MLVWLGLGILTKLWDKDLRKNDVWDKSTGGCGHLQAGSPAGIHTFGVASCWKEAESISCSWYEQGLRK